MASPDYYTVLQVAPGAEPEVIDAAYKRLAFKYHPDRNSDPAAHVFMRQLNEAYEVLANPVERRRYDEQRRHTPRAEPEGTRRPAGPPDPPPPRRASPPKRPVPRPRGEDGEAASMTPTVRPAGVVTALHIRAGKGGGGCAAVFGLAVLMVGLSNEWPPFRYAAYPAMLLGSLAIVVAAAARAADAVPWSEEEHDRPRNLRAFALAVGLAATLALSGSCLFNAVLWDESFGSERTKPGKSQPEPAGGAQVERSKDR
jgi:hypothetical protein